MNTIASCRYGWGTLFVAGGGAYYFAKKSFNADHASRLEAEMEHKAPLAAMEAQDIRKHATHESDTTPSKISSLKRADMARYPSATDDVASPSADVSHGPASRLH